MNRPSHQSIVEYIANMNMDPVDRDNYELSEEELQNLWITDLARRLEQGQATAEDMLDIVKHSDLIGQRLRYNTRIRGILYAMKRS